MLIDLFRTIGTVGEHIKYGRRAAAEDTVVEWLAKTEKVEAAPLVADCFSVLDSLGWTTGLDAEFAGVVWLMLRGINWYEVQRLEAELEDMPLPVGYADMFSASEVNSGY